MDSFKWKIYSYRFFDDLIVIYPLYTVMFADYGISPVQIGILLSIWSATSFLFEVPSGVIADKYSRKYVSLAGQLLRFIGYFCWLAFPSFLGFAIGFFFWGVKSALTSGTFQALIYDNLKFEKRESEFTKIYGSTKTIAFLAILVASALSSVFAGFGYFWIMILSCASLLISSLMIVLVKEAPIAESTNETGYFDLLKSGLKIIVRKPNVLYLTIFLSLSFALGGALDEYWTLFAEGAGVPHYGLGIFLGLMSAVQATGSFFAHLLEKKKSKIFYGAFFLNGIFLLLAAYLYNVFALVFLIIFSLSFTVIQTIFEGRLQENLSSESRATASSVNGFLTEIGVIIVYFTFGLFSQIGDYRLGFGIYGLLIAIIGLYYFFNNRKEISLGNANKNN